MDWRARCRVWVLKHAFNATIREWVFQDWGYTNEWSPLERLVEFLDRLFVQRVQLGRAVDRNPLYLVLLFNDDICV